MQKDVDDIIEKLHKKIEERNSKLGKLFIEKNAEAMGKEFGEDLVLFTPEGEMKRGMDEIAKFWESAMNRRVENLTFTRAEILHHPLNVQCTGKTKFEYDLVALEYSEFFFGSDYGGCMKHGWRHRHHCDWP